MINKLLTIFLIFCPYLTFSQIGIGTDLPDQSAMLEISSKNKGILIPQISLSNLHDNQVIEGNNPKEGLLIFNTNENVTEDLVKGFYFWDIDKKVGTNKGTWVKLVGSLDSYVLNPVLGTITLKKGDKDKEQGRGFTYDPGNGSTVDFYESLTALNSEIVLIDQYDDGTTEERKSGVDRNYEKAGYLGTRQRVTFSYVDEFGETTDIVLNELVGESETITSLKLIPDYTGESNDEESRPVLIFEREDNKQDVIELSEIMQNSETLTSLSVDVPNGALIYKDENKNENSIELGPLFKQPWAKANGTTESPMNGDAVFTNGWVGIGYDKPSGAPNEKLRVNGSITAVNSYYADYVFEKYFKGSSELRKEYSFLSLDKVEKFISENYHLPGVTSVNKVDKQKEGYVFNISELSIQLLEKTEELFLYIIEQQRQIENLNKKSAEFNTLKKDYDSLKTSFDKLSKEMNQIKAILKAQIINK